MSRSSNLSPQALRQFYSPDADSTLIMLLTVYGEDGSTVVGRLCDNFTQRISEDDNDVVYGVVSRANSYVFLPMQFSPPSEEDGSVPACKLLMFDPTRSVIPVIRSASKPHKTKIELVLSKTPDTVEISFEDFYITSFQYNAEVVTVDLMMLGMEREAIPMFSFTPQYNPGLFAT